MANVDVKSIAGKKAGSIELDASVFEARFNTGAECNARPQRIPTPQPRGFLL